MSNSFTFLQLHFGLKQQSTMYSLNRVKFTLKSLKLCFLYFTIWHLHEYLLCLFYTTLDPAINWEHTYAFGRRHVFIIRFLGDEYYRFSNVLQIQPDVGYPRPLSIWSEQFGVIDASFQYKDRRTYFFSGNQYYRYNDTAFDVCI